MSLALMVVRMGMFGSGAPPYVPAAAYTPPPPPPPPPPTPVDKAVTDAAEAAKAKARAAQGYGSTIATSGQGVLDPVSTTGKTLLGQ